MATATQTSTTATTNIVGGSINTPQTIIDPIFTNLQNPVKNTIKRVIQIAKGQTATIGSYKDYVDGELFTGSFPSSNVSFSIFTGTNTSTGYKGIQMMLRQDVQNITSDWQLIRGETGSKIDNFLVLSFDNNCFGDRLLPGGGQNVFEFTLNGIKYEAKSPTLNLQNYDIKSHLLSSSRGFAQIIKSSNNQHVGYMFGQLGLILFIKDIGSTLQDKTLIADNIIAQQTTTRQTYFCRITNQRYNASNNPTWYEFDSNTGVYVIRNKDIYDDSTYTAITSIGLYSQDNELLAIAKLSQPVMKYIDSQLHVKVSIQY